MTQIEMIGKKYSEDELIDKLSEISSRLVQATVKVRESIKKEAATAYEENIELLHEELAAIFICIDVLEGVGVVSMDKIMSIEDRAQIVEIFNAERKDDIDKSRKN